jgi:hypothetical protein
VLITRSGGLVRFCSKFNGLKTECTVLCPVVLSETVSGCETSCWPFPGRRWVSAIRPGLILGTVGVGVQAKGAEV